MTQTTISPGDVLLERVVHEPGNVIHFPEKIDPHGLEDEGVLFQAITDYLETADALPQEQDIYVVLVSVASLLLDEAGHEHSLANIGRVLGNLIQVYEDAGLPVLHDPDMRVSVEHEYRW